MRSSVPIVRIELHLASVCADFFDEREANLAKNR